MRDSACKPGSQPPKADGFHRSRTLDSAGLGVVLALTVVLYSGSLQIFFFQDDYTWLLYSRFNSVWEYLQVFFRFNQWGTYRPLGQESFFGLAQKLFGLSPTGFHVIVLSVHLADVALLYGLLRRFFSPLPCLGAALFYAVHPSHISSLYWLSAFPEPLAVFFYLAAFMLFLCSRDKSSRRMYLCSLLCMILGTMSKESILTLPLALSIYCLLFQRLSLISTIPFYLVAGTYGLMRLLSATVRIIPYGATSASGALKNLIIYFCWSCGLPDRLFRPEINSPNIAVYAPVALAISLLVILLIIISRNRKYALFAVLWYLLALQPVLYFSGHIYPYYLAPALPAAALLLASIFPPFEDSKRLPGWLPVFLTALIWTYVSARTIRTEGGHWYQRSQARQNAVKALLEISSKVPNGATAYIFGMKPEQFDALENGGVFRLYSISPQKFTFVFPPYDEELRSRLSRMRGSRDMAAAYCYEIADNSIIDKSHEFREDPERFFLSGTLNFVEMPGVHLVMTPHEARHGKDTLRIQVVGLHVKAIDVIYTLDGHQMPPIVHWLLDDQHRATVFIDSSTPAGLYRYNAIRDSEGETTKDWIKVSAEVEVK